jgi:multidrug resistance efflux pump
MALHPSPHEVVPRLRKDLNISGPPTGTGAEVIRVGPAGSNDRVALHGFELSIALMLDGKRTLQDVVLNCEKLGLPVDPEGLARFIRQLKCYGFFTHGDDVPQRGRDAWVPGVRAQFRAALHAARAGHLGDARYHLDKLLALAPATPEALELVDWIDARAKGPAGKPFQETLEEVEKSWAEELRTPFLDEVRQAVRRSPMPLVAGIAALTLLCGGALVPLPRIVPTSVELTPAVELPVVARHAGTVGTVSVQEGEHIAAGALLFTWDTTDVELQLLDTRERLDALREALYAVLRHQPAAQAPWARLQQAEAGLARAHADLLTEQRDNAGGETTDATTPAELRFNEAETEAEAARSALDALAPSDSAEAMALESVVLEIRMLEEQLQAREVLADTEGTISHLDLRPGEHVAEGQKLAQLDELSRLKAVAVLTPREAASVRVGEPVTLHLGKLNPTATVEALSGYELAVEVPNPGGALKVGSTTADLELTPRSIFDRIRGR